MDGIENEQAGQGDDRRQRKLANYAHLGDIELELTLELGRRQMSLEELDELREQHVIELDKLAGEAFEVRVNDQIFAFGEIVVVTDLLACRLTELVKP